VFREYDVPIDPDAGSRPSNRNYGSGLSLGNALDPDSGSACTTPGSISTAIIGFTLSTFRTAT